MNVNFEYKQMTIYFDNHRTCGGDGGNAEPLPPKPGKRKAVIAIGVAVAAAVMQLAQAELADAPTQVQLPGGVAVQPAEPEMVLIPSGQFEMGSNDYGDEKPPHRVSIRAFELDKYKVTQGQWRAVMGSNPSAFSDCGDNCPVDRISWNDAQQFIQTLNQKTGKTFRLPSEAEWEYAARAGTTTTWSCGDDESALGQYAWFRKNSGGKTYPVGQKKPNGFGLYDMHGSLYEWVQDCDEKNYSHGQPTDGSAHRGNDSSCTHRVLRGSTWVSEPQFLRPAVRARLTPDIRFIVVGFRLARSVP